MPRPDASPLLALLLLAGCGALGVGRDDHRIVETRTGATVDLEAVIDALADRDVVFLGEDHSSDVGHRLQLRITEGLLRRRGDLVLSLEMFERDVQADLDRYLAGEIDEATFLEHARPWRNYREHYRPAVELARRAGIPVLAANVPRPLAARVARGGLESVRDEPHTPRFVDAGPGDYFDRFSALMGDHGGDSGKLDAEDVFAAQCIKDDAMAETIVDHLAARRPPAPLVVHWCGHFHSDHGLGTVERLTLRRPNLAIGIVGMATTNHPSRPLTEDERTSADFLLLVPETE